MGGDPTNPNVIEVIDIACDECPVGGYDVTEACRGCIAHRCEDVCRMGAITFDEASEGAHRQVKVRKLRSSVQRFVLTALFWNSSVRVREPAR